MIPFRVHSLLRYNPGDWSDYPGYMAFIPAISSRDFFASEACSVMNSAAAATENEEHTGTRSISIVF